MRFNRRLDAVAWLEDHVDFEKVAPNRADVPTLQPVRDTLAALADPHHDYPVIHVTGTNGKGTTTTLISALLRDVGYTVGTFTSPDLHRLNERIAVNGEPIDDVDLTVLFSRLADVEDAIGIRLTRFEILTVAALLHFSDVGVEVAAVEVGLGGTWDSTNVIDGVVAVLTNVDLDHTAVLGDSVRAIASDKVGIIKSGATVVLGTQDDEVVEIATDKAREVGATLVRYGQEFLIETNEVSLGGRMITFSTDLDRYEEVQLGLHGIHQGRNAATAVCAVEAFFQRPLDEEVVRNVLGNAVMAGRMEVLAHYPLIVIDGAHNPAGMRALASTLEETFHVAGERRVVIGMLTGRDVDDMVSPLLELGVSGFVVCRPASPRAQEPERVAEALRARGAEVVVVDDVVEAVEYVRDHSTDADQIVIAGSLYVVGVARAHLLGLVHDHSS